MIDHSTTVCLDLDLELNGNLDLFSQTTAKTTVVFLGTLPVAAGSAALFDRRQADRRQATGDLSNRRQEELRQVTGDSLSACRLSLRWTSWTSWTSSTARVTSRAVALVGGPSMFALV